MQVYLRETPTIVAQSAIFLPAENIKLSPVDVDDITKVAFKISRDGDHESKGYDMTGPEALTMTDVAERISSAIGKTVRYVNLEPEERRRALLAAGVSPAFADALDEQTAERLKPPESRVYLGTHEAFQIRPTRLQSLRAGTRTCSAVRQCRLEYRALEGRCRLIARMGLPVSVVASWRLRYPFDKIPGCNDGDREIEALSVSKPADLLDRPMLVESAI